MRRRPARRKKEKLGREAFQVVGPGNVILAEHADEGPALVLAQRLLTLESLKRGEGEDLHYTVQLKPLFGEPDTLYHVVLTRADGAVLTYRHETLRTA